MRSSGVVLRSVVDRRFNRARCDATRTTEAFGRDVRDEVGLEVIVADLRAAAGRTVQQTATEVVLVSERRP